MSDSMKQLLGQIKILVTYFIGWAVGHNYIDSELGSQLTGMAGIVLPMVWEYVEKRYAQKKTEEKVVSAVNVGVAVADPTATPLTVGEAKDAVASANAKQGEE